MSLGVLYYKKYYDEFVVLLGTGMRVSEFCGLTKSDIDFENRWIQVDHQLVRERGGKYYVEKTKAEAGRRFIPMTQEVYESLKPIVAKRKPLKVEHVIDGYSGFIERGKCKSGWNDGVDPTPGLRQPRRKWRRDTNRINDKTDNNYGNW